MNGIIYNLVTEWRREVYQTETGDTSLQNVPARVLTLWENFHAAHQLPYDEQVIEFDRILTDFQTNGWAN